MEWISFIKLRAGFCKPMWAKGMEVGEFTRSSYSWQVPRPVHTRSLRCRQSKVRGTAPGGGRARSGCHTVVGHNRARSCIQDLGLALFPHSPVP